MSVYPKNVDFIHVSEFMEQNAYVCMKKVFFKPVKKVINTVYGTSVVHFKIFWHQKVYKWSKYLLRENMFLRYQPASFSEYI